MGVRRVRPNADYRRCAPSFVGQTFTGHLYFTSCHLQCIEALTGSPHSGVVRRAITAVLVVAGLLGAAIDAGAAPDPAPPSVADKDGGLRFARARVQVRVYDTTVMSVADQTVALRAATGVLAAAGIDISWLICGSSDAAANPADCAAPLTRDELAVRLVRLAGTPSPRGQLSLGYSLLDMSVGGGTLATVYVDRVEWLVSQARDDQDRRRGSWKLEVGSSSEGAAAARVLGFAVAHELGHLLLGTNAHAAAGLMRAVWSRSDLQRTNPADWRFTPVETLAMSRAIRQRQVQMAANIVWTK